MSQDHRRRGPDGTLQRRIFLLLRDHASMTAPEIAKALGADEQSTRRACCYLRHRKPKPFLSAHHVMLPTAAGLRRFVLFAAACEREPKDRRGKSARSRNHRGAVAFANWTVMMTRRYGPHWRPKVRPGIALEEVWPMGSA